MQYSLPFHKENDTQSMIIQKRYGSEEKKKETATKFRSNTLDNSEN